MKITSDNSRFQVISKELRRMRRWIGWLSTGGCAVISFGFKQFGWEYAVGIAAIISILGILAIQIILIWRLSKQSESPLWSDRKYLLFRNKWEYQLNEDQCSLDGVCEGERKLICKDGTISYLTIAIGPKENLLPLDPNRQYEVALLHYERKEGTVSARDPHRKQGASFAFQIDFNPPLKVNEEVYVKYRYKIPNFKIANFEFLRDRTREAKLDTRDYEYNALTISYDIDIFEYEIVFSPSCSVIPKGFEVKRGTSIYTEEQEKILSNDLFVCEKISGSWRMSLKRSSPPLSTTYRLLWIPPKVSELRTSTSRGGQICTQLTKECNV